MSATVEHDLASIPGAMEVELTRILPDGMTRVYFESAPAEWLTKKGEVRRSDWRAYFLSRPGGCERCHSTGRVVGETPRGCKCALCGGTGRPKRERVVSVTTLLDQIIPKGGLPPWSEMRGIEGAREAFRLGHVGLDDPPERWIEQVRANRLGADRARDDAADRGLDTHSVLERWMTTGEAPNPGDHIEAHRGYLQGVARWLLKADPEPIMVEQLVAHPHARYAGRGDLVAMIDGVRTRVDLKTSPNGAIYNGSHAQVRLYEEAEIAAGGEPCDRLLIVVVDDRGGFREMACACSAESAAVALQWARHLAPITSACDIANRAEKLARRAA